MPPRPPLTRAITRSYPVNDEPGTRGAHHSSIDIAGVII
jgi:hypothetical protein